MDTDILELVLQAGVGLAVVYLVYTFLSEFGSETERLSEEQIQGSDSTLAELYINISPQSFFFLRVLVALGGFGIGLTAINFIFGLILGFLGYWIPGVMLQYLKAKRVKLIETQLVEGLELLGNSLKSGLTLQQSMELLVKEFPPPISQEFNLVLAESRLGVDLNDALANMANRLNSLIVQILASGVAITKRCGGDLTVIFQNIASTIREQATIEGKLDAVTAQGRFQALILGGMPFALIFILYFIDRAHVETLFGYTLGHWAIGAVIVMVGLAQAWIQKLLQIDV